MLKANLKENLTLKFLRIPNEHAKFSWHKVIGSAALLILHTSEGRILEFYK